MTTSTAEAGALEREEETAPARSGVQEGAAERRRRSSEARGFGWCGGGGGLVDERLRRALRSAEAARSGRRTAGVRSAAAAAMGRKWEKPS